MNIQNEEIIIVKCPECESRYRVDSKLLTRPRTVRCVNCSYIWLYRDKNFQKDALNEDSKDLDQNYINENYHNQNSFGDFDYEENENLEELQIENENNYQDIPHKNDIESSKFYEEGEDSNEFEDDDEYSDDLNEDDKNKDSNEFEDDDENVNQNELEEDHDEEDSVDNKENVNQNELEEDHDEEDSVDNKENDIFADLFSQLDKIKNSKEDDKDERKNNNNHEDDNKDENQYSENDEDDYIYDDEIENEDEGEDDEIENENDDEVIYDHDENEDDDKEEDEQIDAKEDKIEKIEEEDEIENEEDDKGAKITDDGFIKKLLNKFVWFIIFILLICGILFTSVNFSYKLPEFGRNILKIFNIQDFNNILISDSRILISNYNDHNNLNLLLTIVNLSKDTKDFILDEIFIKLYDDDGNVYDYKIKNIYVIKSGSYNKIYCKIPFLKFIPQKIDVRIGNEKIKYK